MFAKRWMGWIFIISATIIVSVAAIEPYFILNEKITDKEKRVAAFYYGWYSNSTDYSQTIPYEITDDDQWRHWDGTKDPNELTITNHPIDGLYDCADPYIIEKHLEQAEWGGLDSFIVSYWGKNGAEFTNFINMLEVANYIESKITLSLYFETGMGGLPEMDEEEAVDFLTDELENIHDTMTSDNYKDSIWFEDDKPVLFAYVVQWLAPTVWEQALKELENEGKSFFLVADRPGSLPNYNNFFQATHTYDGYAPVRDGTTLSTNLMLKMNAMRYNQLYISGVHPGYDDTRVREGNAPFEREDGAYYKARWEEAISMNPDWITITSWNEWHEGTEIEPSIEHGDKALQQTKDYIVEFKSGNYELLSINMGYFSKVFWSIIALAASWMIFLTFPKHYPKFRGKINIRLNSRTKKFLLFSFLLISWMGLIALFIAEVMLGYLLMISGNFYVLILPLFTFINAYIGHADLKNDSD